MESNAKTMTREEAKQFADGYEAMINETMSRLSDDIAAMGPEEDAAEPRKIVEDVKAKLLERWKQARRELLGPD